MGNSALVVLALELPLAFATSAPALRRGLRIFRGKQMTPFAGVRDRAREIRALLGRVVSDVAFVAEPSNV